MKNSIKYPIKAVSNLTGLSIYVIRAWEKRYNAVVPERTETNRRLYSQEDVEKLKLLHLASENGHSIGTIAHYNIDELKKIVGDTKDVPSVSKISFSEPEGATNNKYLINSIKYIEELDVNSLEHELYKALVDLPQPKFIKEVIAPLLEKIGFLWKEGDIRIVNEHLSTAVIRKILTSLIDNNSVPNNAPSILLATPRGQLHELGALIIGVIASADGWNVIYMGPNLPGEEIAAAIDKIHPKVVALSIVYPSDDFTLDREMIKLKSLLNNGSVIIAGGRSAMSYEQALNDMNAKIILDIDEFRNELETLRI